MLNANKTPMLVGWHEDFKQHKEIIDEQHRAILATVNSIHYLALKADESNIVKHVMMLHTQLQMHFQTELHILQQHESPLMSVYELQAKEFLDSLLDVLDAKNHEHQTQQLFDKFKTWWQHHLALHEEITPYLFKWEGDFCRVVA